MQDGVDAVFVNATLTAVQQRNLEVLEHAGCYYSFTSSLELTLN